MIDRSIDRYHLLSRWRELQVLSTIAVLWIIMKNYSMIRWGNVDQLYSYFVNSCSHLIYDSLVLTTRFLLRLRGLQPVFSHVQHKSALRLSNLFLERSVKQQAHYFSRLETRKIQLVSCKTRLETRNFRGSRSESHRVSQLASDCQLSFERYCIFLWHSLTVIVFSLR